MFCAKNYVSAYIQSSFTFKTRILWFCSLRTLEYSNVLFVKKNVMEDFKKNKNSARISKFRKSFYTFQKCSQWVCKYQVRIKCIVLPQRHRAHRGFSLCALCLCGKLQYTHNFAHPLNPPFYRRVANPAGAKKCKIFAICGLWNVRDK